METTYPPTTSTVNPRSPTRDLVPPVSPDGPVVREDRFTPRRPSRDKPPPSSVLKLLSQGGYKTWEEPTPVSRLGVGGRDKKVRARVYSSAGYVCEESVKNKVRHAPGEQGLNTGAQVHRPPHPVRTLSSRDEVSRGPTGTTGYPSRLKSATGGLGTRQDSATEDKTVCPTHHGFRRRTSGTAGLLTVGVSSEGPCTPGTTGTEYRTEVGYRVWGYLPRSYTFLRVTGPPTGGLCTQSLRAQSTGFTGFESTSQGRVTGGVRLVSSQTRSLRVTGSPKTRLSSAGPIFPLPVAIIF